VSFLQFPPYCRIIAKPQSPLRPKQLFYRSYIRVIHADFVVFLKPPPALDFFFLNHRQYGRLVYSSLSFNESLALFSSEWPPLLLIRRTWENSPPPVFLFLFKRSEPSPVQRQPTLVLLPVFDVRSDAFYRLLVPPVLSRLLCAPLAGVRTGSPRALVSRSFFLCCIGLSSLFSR